jgi:hypothetical protein
MRYMHVLSLSELFIGCCFWVVASAVQLAAIYVTLLILNQCFTVLTTLAITTATTVNIIYRMFFRISSQTAE